MKTILKRANEFAEKTPVYVPIRRDTLRTGYIQGASEQLDIDIEQAKRAICSTCFTLLNNGECKGIEQLADEFEYCEFMKLFLAEMKGE